MRLGGQSPMPFPCFHGVPGLTSPLSNAHGKEGRKRLAMKIWTLLRVFTILVASSPAMGNMRMQNWYVDEPWKHKRKCLDASIPIRSSVSVTLAVYLTTKGYRNRLNECIDGL
jgi:hypothetical protein